MQKYFKVQIILKYIQTKMEYDTCNTDRNHFKNEDRRIKVEIEKKKYAFVT